MISQIFITYYVNFGIEVWLFGSIYKYIFFLLLFISLFYYAYRVNCEYYLNKNMYIYIFYLAVYLYILITDIW